MLAGKYVSGAARRSSVSASVSVIGSGVAIARSTRAAIAASSGGEGWPATTVPTASRIAWSSAV